MPVVRGVISCSTESGSRLWVAGSTSQNTGVMPCHWSACAVATNVKAGTITSCDMPGGPDGDLQRDGAVAGDDAVRARR